MATGEAQVTIRSDVRIRSWVVVRDPSDYDEPRVVAGVFDDVHSAIIAIEEVEGNVRLSWNRYDHPEVGFWAHGRKQSWHIEGVLLNRLTLGLAQQ